MSLYEIISLIIGGLGTIATFSAVMVTLWQTKYANKKKLCAVDFMLVNGNEYKKIKEENRKLDHSV